MATSILTVSPLHVDCGQNFQIDLRVSVTTPGRSTVRASLPPGSPCTFSNGSNTVQLPGPNFGMAGVPVNFSITLNVSCSVSVSVVTLTITVTDAGGGTHPGSIQLRPNC
jgi:hypothetical protein